MNITFIGNCQTASLCFYFQQLLSQEYDIKWLMYGEEFRDHLNEWSHKVKNKIVDYEVSWVDVIKNSDIVVYQEIIKEKSLFSNTETLQACKKESCILVKIPVVYLDYSNYDDSVKELKRREIEKNVDISASDILEKYKELRIVRNIMHPTTFFFLELVDKICRFLKIDIIFHEKKQHFLQNDNYIGLP